MSLNGKLAGTVDALLHRSPAQSFWRWRSSRRLVVLAYHEIRDVGVFADQIGHLKATMRPVSLAEVLGAIRTGRSLPRGAVLVTFDDGDRTLHDDARPVLQMAGVPAVAFVVPGLLDTDIPFWWREVEAL